MLFVKYSIVIGHQNLTKQTQTCKTWNKIRLKVVSKFRTHSRYGLQNLATDEADMKYGLTVLRFDKMIDSFEAFCKYCTVATHNLANN